MLNFDLVCLHSTESLGSRLVIWDELLADTVQAQGRASRTKFDGANLARMLSRNCEQVYSWIHKCTLFKNSQILRYFFFQNLFIFL